VPDQQLHAPSSDLEVPSNQSMKREYTIRRKGSLYNIIGPEGRVFTKNQSARVAGPRWEELTHTPWPYPSKAYEPGLRLWQLGLIDRDQVGQRQIQAESVPTAEEAAPQPTEEARTMEEKAKPVIILPSRTVLALPAPRIDLQEQACLMQALRRDPVMLFNGKVQEALRHEVEYHLSQARWASHLLKLLARYEQRQQRRKNVRPIKPETVTAKHIAWQEQRFSMTAAAGRS
jgi:hypothetical protein